MIVAPRRVVDSRLRSARDCGGASLLYLAMIAVGCATPAPSVAPRSSSSAPRSSPSLAGVPTVGIRAADDPGRRRRAGVEAVPVSTLRTAGLLRPMSLACVAMLVTGCTQLRPTVETARSLAPAASPALTSAESVPQNHSPGLDGSSNTIAFGGRIGSPVVQPNGTLLFDGDIFTVGVDGTNLRRVTTSGGGKGSFSWSPDGLRIVFRWDPTGRDWNRSDIAIVTLGDLKVTTLAHDAWSPAWSPNGDWIAYFAASNAASDGSGLYLIRPDGSDNHQILAGDAQYPAWSPDGRRLAFMSLGDPAGMSSAAYDLYVVDVGGGNVRRLTNLIGEDGWPAWSHDGSRIAYTRFPTEAESEIHIMSADGQDDRLITDKNGDLEEYNPSWSPNDLYIAYHAYTYDESPTVQSGIFAILPDGSGRLLIRPDGFEPAWQPVLVP
jgi:Tol biopolymer transport system component